MRRAGATNARACGAAWGWLVAGLLLFVSAPAFASTLELLIMPGRVIEKHADLESNCEQCHVPFTKKEQKVRCVICHNAVAADLLRARGYHGRDERARTLECKFCHTEHIGRDADIVGLDEAVFDHRITDFVLEGAHTGVACEGCHRRDKKHRDAPSECKDCHAGDDVHRGRLGEACADCHSAEGWTKTPFDHSETDFALRGEHRKVPCEQCHANARYEGTPTTCYSCHKLNDSHGGRFGRECKSCHRPTGWDDVTFDHGEETDFELVGKHREAKCKSCHTGRLGKEQLGTACIDCHRADDSHRGKNGTRCDDCHLPNGWKESRFDHERESGFALKGEHRKLKCEACHRGALTVELSTSCVSCHRAGDSHLGGLGEKCESCHVERGWNKVDFDHGEKANFPLRGSHENLKCHQCHLPRLKGDELSRNCFACHKRDDPHRGKLGKRCDQCHNETAWRSKVFFEHDLTKFPLIGLHAVTACEECHATAAYTGTPTTCRECHAGDDSHEGRFGDTSCGRCHNPNGWPLWLFDHNRETDFALDGAHLGIDCHGCHSKQAARRGWLSTSCHACHRVDDVHRGAFGRACDRCHTTTSFEEVRGR